MPALEEAGRRQIAAARRRRWDDASIGPAISPGEAFSLGEAQPIHL